MCEGGGSVGVTVVVVYMCESGDILCDLVL